MGRHTKYDVGWVAIGVGLAVTWLILAVDEPDICDGHAIWSVIGHHFKIVRFVNLGLGYAVEFLAHEADKRFRSGRSCHRHELKGSGAGLGASAERLIMKAKFFSGFDQPTSIVGYISTN